MWWILRRARLTGASLFSQASGTNNNNNSKTEIVKGTSVALSQPVKQVKTAMVLDNDENYHEDVIAKKDNKNNERSVFVKQLFVTSGLWTYTFMFGLNLGAPTVIIPQIRPLVNTTFAITNDMESWLSSMMGFAGLPCILVLPTLSYVIGRKPPCIFISITSLIGFIIFYCSTSVSHLFVYQIVQGPLAASQICTTILVASEYISPRYRGVFLTMHSATMFWGIWVSNAIGTFTHWRHIALFGIICSLYSTASVIFWPESPYWLAIGGRLEECTKSHRWLNGTSEKSEQELADLLKLYIRNRRNSQSIVASIKGHTNDFLKVLWLPEVYKCIGISVLVANMYHFSGKFVCTMYSLDIIKKLTNNESAAYTGMLLIDGATVIGMYSGSFLTKPFKRRTYCLVTCALSIIFLFTISLYSYLIKFGVIIENIYITISLLVCFSLAVSIGPMSTTPVLLGELLPLKSRCICLCVLAFYSKCVLSIMLKITPYIFKTFKFHGTFLFFGVVSSVGLLLFSKYLPETKDKTLIEICEILKGTNTKVDESKELMLQRVCNDANDTTENKC